MLGARGSDRGHVRPSIAIAATALVLCVAAASPAAAANLDRLVAPTSVCKGQATLQAPAWVQKRAMLCMTNFARRQVGRSVFTDAAQLDRSAVRKSKDILRCDSFSHSACGRSFTYWIQRSGYLSQRCWRAGENIAWGTGSLGTVRSIFVAWLHSEGHRENILGRFSQIGIGLRRGTLDSYREAHVWTQHFGSLC